MGRMNRPAALLAIVLAGVGAGAGDGPAWHCHSLGKPRVLYLAASPNSEMLAEELRHVVPAEVAFAPLRYGDLEMHHLCDKPLEESKEDQEYVRREGAAYFDGLVAHLGEFQVVIAQLPVRSSDKAESDRLIATQKALADYARGGGKLVVINPGWEAAYEGTPLDGVLPVRSGKAKSWVYSCGPATDHPLSRGIPLEVTGAHFYGPVYEPADATCSPLTGAVGAPLVGARPGAGTSPAPTRFWHRRLPGGSEVVHLFQVGGQKHQWRGENAGQYDPERPDDGAAWQAFYRRLFYGLAFGDAAFPVLVRVCASPCRAGEALDASVAVENRSGGEREVAVSLEVQHRRSPDAIREVKKVTLVKGESATLAFAPKVGLPCTDAFLLVRAQALDADGKTILSESTTWVPYIHRVPLSVATDKPSYRPGETITATVSWAPDAEEGDFLPVAYIVDRSGRALKRAGFVASGERTATAKLLMPDRGPEFVGCYWVTAVFSKQGQIAGLARAQVQLDQPWTMRERFEWSVWTGGGGGRLMELMRDAGFNALGYPGNACSADRYGMRQYVEGTGINTFSVEINHDNWEAVRAAMEKTIGRLNEGGPDARSKSLVSLGEESGFKGGWGARYYWPEDKAPAVPQKVFNDYLRERYGGDIARLNAEWGTSHAAFGEIPLEKAKVRAPGQVFVTSQAWEAMQKKGEAKPVIPVDVSRLAPSTSLGAGPKQKYIGHSASYWEAYNFFDWYYQKYCDLAAGLYRARRNPVPRTIMSAPGGFYPKVDVYNFGGQGPFYPKEAALVANAIARRDYGDVPGFSAAMWAYFDLRSLWNCVVMSSILAGNTHIDYWVDVPLTFNADLTHTRASFWTKELRERLRPIEPILLHKRFAYTDGLGMLTGQQPLPKGILGKHFGSAIDPNAPIYSALEETGYMPKVVHAKALEGIKVLVASHVQVLDAEEGKAVAEFVRGGGLLISTPWLASCSPHGNALTVYPAEEAGLAELLGFRLLNTSQAVVKEEATLSNLPQVWNLREVTLTSKGKDGVLDIAPDVEVLATHNDGTPLILSRRVGKGRVVYLNFIYDWDGWWNSFHEPAREAYRKLVDAIIRSDGRVKPEYFIAFESAEAVADNKGWWQVPLKSKPAPGESVPWWASQLYSDPSGRIKYLAIFSDHRSPKIGASVRWATPGVRVFDLLARAELPVASGGCALSLRPGEAALWAIVAKPPEAIRLRAPARLEAGCPTRIEVSLVGGDPQAVHGAVLDVYCPDGRPSAAHSLSNVQLAAGRAEAIVPTALNDPPGEYRIVATESASGSAAETRFRLVPAAPTPREEELTAFPPRAGETWPALPRTAAELLADLRRLRDVYHGTWPGLEAKYMLSYHLNVPFRPHSRHALVRRLVRADWQPHIPALAQAIRAGERFYLAGEDAAASHTDPFQTDGFARALESLCRMPGARQSLVHSNDMTFRLIELGKGALVILKDASADRAAYHSSDFAAWHERLKKALKEVR